MILADQKSGTSEADVFPWEVMCFLWWFNCEFFLFKPLRRGELLRGSEDILIKKIGVKNFYCRYDVDAKYLFFSFFVLKKVN